MSGGFFRGTTADQDTRFSNKQAKLLKTQKFPAELEHLVDVSKVKMDVIKPWIAKRITEFLGGFEDEVLINFIYGLLEGKEINGKAIQIQLTGFMEKNTGKFMKELWTLLLRAQNNASGVPQQFLDAKAEETRKKKVETDRITNEIQKRKETEQEKRRKTDSGLDNSSAEESVRKRERHPDSPSGDGNGADVQNGGRGRNRSPRFPNPSNRSPSPHRGRRSRSISKSYSNSRSRSKGRSVSKSISPGPITDSVSPEIISRSPQRSVSPRKPIPRVSISPWKRSNSRSLSSTRRGSPSPVRRRLRTPPRRRSPSPIRHRSRSPLLRRSPLRRRRSPSPWRRCSPFLRRRRSPSPIRQRRRRSTSSPRPLSPVQRRRSPFPRRRRPTSSPRSQSPTVRCRHQSPVRRRSPFSVRRRSPSPDRRGSPLSRRPRTPSPFRCRSPSPVRISSPIRLHRRSSARSSRRSVSSNSRSSPSPVRDRFRSPIKIKSPGRHGSPREKARLNDCAEPVMVSRKQSMAMSPQRDHSDVSRSRRKVPSVPPLPEKSPSYMGSPKQKTRTSNDDRSSYGSFHKRAEDHSGQHSHQEDSKNFRSGEQNKLKLTERRSDLSHGALKKQSLDEPPSRCRDPIKLRQNSTEMASLEVTPEKVNAAKKSPHTVSVPGNKQDTFHTHDASKSDEKRISPSKDLGDNSKIGVLVNPRKKGRSTSASDSGSEGSVLPEFEVTEKRKHRRSSRLEAASDDSTSDSEIEDRKEAKRRKKEERKLRKEERRRRCDERRCRREEKRASKRQRKDADALSPDLKKNEQIEKASNGERMSGKYSSEEEEAESQQKKLEIDLREKALESLRAKKGIRH